jgi:hypothetical protein
MSSQHTFASPADALRALFAAWPSDKGDGTGLTEAYIIAIQGYSLKAIDGAVKRIIRGEADDIDRRFLPSPAQLGNLVARMEKLYEPVPPRQALPAPVRPEPTEEERQRVADRIRQWVKDRTPDPVAAFKPREPGDIVRQMRAEGMKLSDAALATFTKDHLDRVAVADPAEQFDAWEKARTTPPTPTEIPNTDRRVA